MDGLELQLTRYKVKEGMSGTVDEWMELLRGERDAVLDTLAREQMALELIFRERAGGDDYLYWLSIQRPGGAGVETSEHAIDREHMRYWAMCIDSSVEPVECALEVPMIPVQAGEALRLATQLPAQKVGAEA